MVKNSIFKGFAVNVKKIALFVGVFWCIGINSSIGWFEAGESLRNPVRASNLFMAQLAFDSLKVYSSNRLAEEARFSRVMKSNSRYSADSFKFSEGKALARPALYFAADMLVAPDIFNSSLLDEALKNYSPETKQEIKNTITIVTASALAKSVEAVYDHECGKKPFIKSTREFCLNATTHVAHQMVYHSIVKPAIKELNQPALEPIVSLAAGYTTAYVIMQMMKPAQ